MPIKQQHFRSGWLWSSVGAMLGVVAVVMWVARPGQQPSCDAARPVPDTGATSRMMVAASSAGVANRHKVVASPPARPGEARYYAFGPGVACSFAGLPTNGFYAGIS